MNGSEAMQLTLVRHMTVTWRHLNFIILIFILHRIYLFTVRKVTSNSNVVPTQTVCDFGCTVRQEEIQELNRGEPQRLKEAGMHINIQVHKDNMNMTACLQFIHVVAKPNFQQP